jgi:2-polyprenyl-3-methyl-5-hydroxy-6-metoxy-1,4-benzoquinol methylase
MSNLSGNLSNLASLNSVLSSSISKSERKRDRCVVCDYTIPLNDISALTKFPCNVRAFRNEKFPVWRCPKCKTIHCLDVVDLAHYYAKYPFADAKLTWVLRTLYNNLYRQLTKQGFSKTHSILDYGCANGLFVQYLQERGFTNCYGYDPYAPKNGFGNPATLKKGPFDYILLQDVIEHVEDPYALIRELDSLLAPGGCIFIGTPNAARIDLKQPYLSDYYNSVHAPYHLHIYTRKTLESLGRCQGWKPIKFIDRAFHDTLLFGLNTRAWNQYQRLFDSSLNVIYESLDLRKALISHKFLFYAIFGYWLSFQTEMTIVFRKM